MIFVLMILLITNPITAYSNFQNDRARGWFWYEEKPQDIEEEGHQELTKNSQISASQELEQLQKDLEERKAAMIMRPSIENAKRYIQYQNEAFKRADKVSEYWQAAILSDPNLNIVKDMPVSDVGARIKMKASAKADKELLISFARDFHLLFFYKKSCDYCTHFADVLEVFSNKYGYKVAAVTLDGSMINKFPAALNQQLADQLNVTYTPSLFAYSERLGIAVPVSNGYLSIDLLEQNMVFVANQIRGKL